MVASELTKSHYQPYNHATIEIRSFEARLCAVEKLKQQSIEGMRHILLVASKNLLDDGVLGVVKQEADLIVAAVEYLNERQFLDEVTAVRPDVILLNENGPLGLPQAIDLVLQIPSLTNTRIITYRVDDNVVSVLDYQRILLAKGADLVSLTRTKK